MEKTSRFTYGVLVFGLVALTVMGGCGLAPQNQNPTGTNTGSLAHPAAIAEQWIQASAKTYTYDGSDLRLVSLIKQGCETCYTVGYEFTSSHGGYGDRAESITTQVITPHAIRVQIKNGEVVSAVTDEAYNEITSAAVPVADKTTVKAYFSDTKKDPNMLKCEVVYPVERSVVKTAALAEAALGELFKGPTTVEKDAGKITNLPTSVEVKRLSFEKGVATIEFARGFDEGIAGACRVAAVRAQIAETLKQDPSIKQVKILVEGKTEAEVLQP